MDPVAVESVLDAVTVYARGAICTRKATVTPSGALPTAVKVKGLPLSLSSGSLRARVVSGPAGVVVRDVRLALDAELPPEGDVPAEQKALEAAEDALAALRTREELLAGRIQHAEALAPAYPQPKRGEPPREAAVDSLLALAAFADGELASLHAERLALAEKLRDAENEVTLRRRRLQEASSALRAQRARVTAAAVVSLEGAGSAPVELAVEYLVPGARWAPSYELAIDRASGAGKLVVRAAVAQRSGEDWRGVQLGLSTADLDRRTEAPELRSLRIGRAQPAAPRSGFREPPSGLEELFDGFDALERPGEAGEDERAVSHKDLSRPADTPAQGIVLGEVVAREQRRRAPGGAPSAGGMPPPAPPPPPKSAPAPMRSMAMQVPASPAGMVSRSGVAAPMKKRAKLDDAAPRRSEMQKEQAFGGGGADYDEELAMPEEAPAAEAMDDLRADRMFEPAPEPEGAGESLPGEGFMDYDRLALAGPRQSARGRLSPRSELELLVTQLSAKVKIELDVYSLFAHVREEAQSVEFAPLPAHACAPRESAGSYDYRYDAERRVDVLGDGAWHTLPLFAAEVECAIEYVTVPSVELQVFRTARLRSRAPQALLAGPADVTLSGAFLMTVPMPTVPPQGERRIGLGVEEAVKVSRNVRFEETSGGVFGGSALLTHGIEIELANRLPHPVLVDVRERIPVTGEKDVHVEEKDVQPKWEKFSDAEQDAEGVHAEGARRWRTTVAPGAKQPLTAKFVVKIPASKQLVGGNRRV